LNSKSSQILSHKSHSLRIIILKVWLPLKLLQVLSVSRLTGLKFFFSLRFQPEVKHKASLSLLSFRPRFFQSPLFFQLRFSQARPGALPQLAIALRERFAQPRVSSALPLAQSALPLAFPTPLAQAAQPQAGPVALFQAITPKRRSLPFLSQCVQSLRLELAPVSRSHGLRPLILRPIDLALF